MNKDARIQHRPYANMIRNHKARLTVKLAVGRYCRRRSIPRAPHRGFSWRRCRVRCCQSLSARWAAHQVSQLFLLTTDAAHAVHLGEGAGPDQGEAPEAADAGDRPRPDGAVPPCCCCLMNRAWVACVWRVAPPNCATTPSCRLSIWGSRGAPRQHHLQAIHCRRSPSAARDELPKHAKIKIEIVFSPWQIIKNPYLLRFRVH